MTCALAVGVLVGSEGEVLAAGKKRPTVPADPGPAPTSPYRAANPVRRVVLRSVGTKPFQLPSGPRVDLTADLETLLLTAVTHTPNFSPTDPGAADPCDNHLEIRASISTLELNVAEIGLTFGYSPSGERNIVAGANGKVGVRIGTIAMDFSVWECVGGKCSAVAASVASHLTAQVNLAFEIDFGVVQTGPSLVFNTPLGDILRKIMNKGMMELAGSSRLHELSWTATVREWVPEVGMMIFDAGAQARLAINQSFVVYAQLEESGVCNVYKPVAYAHTTQVDTVSSYAVVDRILDSRGVRPGDVVMVKP